MRGDSIVKRKKRKLTGRTNNIWNGYDFAMSGLGEKSRLWGKIKHIKRCLKWSKQRVVRGYCDSDVWNMFGYLQMLILDMLQNLKDNRNGSQGFLGENYTDEDGIWVNDIYIRKYLISIGKRSGSWSNIGVIARMRRLIC